MQLADAVALKYGKTDAVRYGVVSSVEDLTLTLRIGGEDVESVPWVESYSPVLGERVAALRSLSGWLVLGAVTSTGTTYKEPVTVEVAPTVRWYASRPIASASWDGYYDPWPSGPPVWEGQPETVYEDEDWAASAPLTISPSDAQSLDQQLGSARTQSGDLTLINYTPSMAERWGAFYYPDLIGVLPSGAVVTRISFSVRNGGAGVIAVQGTPDLWVQGHALTSSTTLDERDGTDPPFAPVTGFENWNAGRVDAGRVGDFVLPQDWATALLARTITGLSFYGPAGTGLYVSDAVDWTVGDYGASVTNVKPFVLRVTYITPVDEEGV